MSARILIADDHGVVRDGLRQMVGACPDLEIAAEAGDGIEALRLAQSEPFDLVVLDISLPGSNGVSVLQGLRAGGSRVPVLFFSMHPAEQYADFVRRAGAQGFIVKDARSDRVIAAMRALLAGGTDFPAVRTRSRQGNHRSPLDTLSGREHEVLMGMVHGEPLLDIAARLQISNKSVGTYRQRILDKLGVANNAELIALVTRFGQP